MLFPTHLLAGYALGRLTGYPVWWVVAGATLPDAVDKPLGTVGVAELYHSVGHSLAALAVVVAVALLADRAWAVAAALGVASHLALDAGQVVINGRLADAAFLGWPVLAPPDPLGLPPVAFARAYVGTPGFYLEGLAWAAAVVVVLAGRSQSRRRDPQRP